MAKLKPLPQYGPTTDAHLLCDCGTLYLRGGGVVSVWCEQCHCVIDLTPLTPQASREDMR